MNYIVSGIQQIGIGVSDVQEAFKWYNKNLGFDVPVFEEAATAGLMLPYTGGEPRDRHAILAMNLQGGGGFEIWQYTSKVPEKATFDIQLGDLGIFICKLKSPDVKAAYNDLKEKGIHLLTEVTHSPAGYQHFYFQGLYGNIFEVIPSKVWFNPINYKIGGVAGATIGVSDMEKSIDFYQKVLGFDQILSDSVARFDDFKNLPGGNETYRRVILTHSKPRIGRFNKLLDGGTIELVQSKDRSPKKIYENRMWGDLGYIHLCFDVIGMEELRSACSEYGSPFTVDSANSFDMGEAAGHFSYIEAPEGTLIEFVETHKIPIFKKIGWYLNLQKRPKEKSLPNWILKSLKYMRVKHK